MYGDEDPMFDGFGLGDPDAGQPRIDPNDPMRALVDLDIERPGMIEAYDRVRRVFEKKNMPPLPPAMRKWKATPQFSVFPIVIDLPDPRLFPMRRERKFNLTLESTTTDAIQGAYTFPEWCTVYAITGIARVIEVDPATTWIDRLHTEIEFTTNSGDQLTPGGQTILDNIAGSGQNPMPVGSPGWAFLANTAINVNGVAETSDWKLWLTFYAITSIPATSSGMSRTAQYTADGR